MNLFSPKTHETIDTLPIYNWNKLIDGELKYIYIKPRPVKRRDEDKLNELWEDLYNDYFISYGLTDQFREQLDKKKRIALMQLDVILKGNRKLITHIEIAESELDETPRAKIEFLETVVTLEKHFGFSIDVHTCSVAKYHSYIKQFNGGS